MQIGLPVPSFAQMLAVLFFGALFTDNYLYYREGTMGSICPQAEININKK
jgi:hypothetical protein